MNNNVHTAPRYDYGHHTTALPLPQQPQPPQSQPTQTGYHPSSDASVPTSSFYPAETDQRVILNNTKVPKEEDQPKLMENIPFAIDRIGYDEREMRTYELVVCQQPLHARMCGFGEKDRRPIDPPPIVQLIVRQKSQEPVDVQTLQIPFFVLHVTLWSADRTEERNIISNPPKCTRVLMGSLVSSPSLLKNPEGEQGLYFAFPDLSIRTEGRYTLRFSLMKLVSADFQTDAKSKIIAQVFSDAFTVYSAKKFPGMTESTDLSKAFAKQGLKIPIRNDVRSRKSDS
ncbi:velvet factor-domain-containing protein [Absidia repens]|uniref:Velvet factor-domain-containing protein n=1 Tax=Absidia repens TaxID=90262 RepID=A0A1X2I5L3_9FUNG|nr:velvet factor-domain-containing protein [Absidia repens]